MQPDSKKVVYINDGTFEKGEVPMDDKEIVELYWQRNEQAIKEAAG